jgi:cobalt-zinc-cadmium resistance protein CzcA
MDTGVRADLGLKIYGDDFAQLNKLAGQAEKILQAVPGAADVTVEQLTGQPVVQVQLRQDELARYGAPAKTVLDVVRAVGGLRVGEAVEGDLRVPLAVRLAEPHRQDVKRLGALLVNTPTGERLPLSRLAEVKLTEGPATIGREWGQRRITVSCNIRGRDLGGFVAEAKEKMASLRLPDERYHLAWGGQFEHYERARNRLAVVVPVAAGLIFMMLYFTYHNVIDALRVFVGVPFGLVGGVFALWLRDMPLSISAIVGFIALSGVAVLDDMILVSTVRQLRRRGMAVRDAVRAAALIRLRPVLMTTLVAALGFLPMALSDGQGAEVQRPLATVVIGGVVGALAMSLLALRVLYLAFDGLAHGLFWMLVRVFRWEEGSARAAVGLDVDVPPNDGGVREGGD